MSQKDFSQYVVGTKIVTECKTYDKKYKTITTDKVYLPSLKEIKYKSDNQLKKKLTAFATLNYSNYPKSSSWFRDCQNGVLYYGRVAMRSKGNISISNTEIGVAPEFALSIQPDIKYDVSKNSEGLPILKLGEYPQIVANDSLNQKLEDLYNNGDLKNGLTSTERWFTSNSASSVECFTAQHNPEFLYNGIKFVRAMGLEEDDYVPKWIQVSPISFIINNWKQLPKTINPRGNGKAKHFELETEKVLLSLPFCDLDVGQDWQTSLARVFLNSDTNNVYDTNYNFKNLGFLHEALNLSREPVFEYTTRTHETSLPKYAFSGCTFLKKVTIGPMIVNIDRHCFDGCNFKYVYSEDKTENLILCNDLPENVNHHQIIDLQKANQVIKNFDYNLFSDRTNFNCIAELVKKLSKAKLQIPFSFLDYLYEEGQIKQFISYANFGHFANEIKNIGEWSELEVFKIAYSLGCFRTDRLLDKNGNITQTTLGQKSSHFLAKLLKDNSPEVKSFLNSVYEMPYFGSLDPKFIQFLTSSGDKGNLQNITDIMELDKRYPNLFEKVAYNFGEVEQYRVVLGADGIPVNLSWKNAIEKYYVTQNFENVKERDQDLARELAIAGASQENFERAVEYRNTARKNNMNAHILGYPLTENYISDIENIKTQTQDELKNAKNNLDNLYQEQFTYEMLDKYDAKNAVMGIYTSCCATIASMAYGATIARQTMQNNDIQNLVIKNSKGKIVAKGTMYVNRKQGYVVINDFELNKNYKQHEIASDGRYKVPKDSEEEIARDKIFNAFMRGIKSFVTEYDSQNPKKPIQKVNVGMGHNRLKMQCKRFEQETHNLSVPISYAFNDAEFEQRVLYCREDEIKKQNQNLEVN